MSVTFNEMLAEARHKPIMKLLEEIRMIVIRRTTARRAYVSKFKGNFGP